MAVTVAFDYKETHRIKNNGGIVTASPKLPSSAGLYIIRNSDDTNTVYVGTTSNLQNRFDERLRVYRESGFTQAALDKIYIYQIKIKIDNVSKAVNDLGYASTVDVEHLLIRSIMSKKTGTSLRNINKWNTAFRSNTRSNFYVDFNDFPIDIAPWIPDDFSMTFTDSL